MSIRIIITFAKSFSMSEIHSGASSSRPHMVFESLSIFDQSP